MCAMYRTAFPTQHRIAVRRKFCWNWENFFRSRWQKTALFIVFIIVYQTMASNRVSGLCSCGLLLPVRLVASNRTLRHKELACTWPKLCGLICRLCFFLASSIVLNLSAILGLLVFLVPETCMNFHQIFDARHRHLRKFLVCWACVNPLLLMFLYFGMFPVLLETDWPYLCTENWFWMKFWFFFRCMALWF